MIKKLLIVSILPVLLIWFSGCQTEDLDPNGGGGQQQDIRTQFLGVWNVDDQAVRLNYKVTIEKHTLYEEYVILKNFADAGGAAEGFISGNTIVLDQQNVGGDYQVEGTGIYIDTQTLHFEFFLDDGIDRERRKAVFSR